MEQSHFQPSLCLSLMERTHFSCQTALLSFKPVVASVSAVAPGCAAHHAESKSSRVSEQTVGEGSKGTGQKE